MNIHDMKLKCMHTFRTCVTCILSTSIVYYCESHLSLWSEQCYLDMLIGYQIGYQVIVFHGTTYLT